MARVITKELALKIVKKLGAVAIKSRARRTMSICS